MKKIIFLVHDPGGYDVVSPLVNKCKEEGLLYEFYCIGPSGNIATNYAKNNEEVIQLIHSMLHKNIPLALVTGTSWGSQIELEAISLFKKFNLPTFSVLDYWTNYSLRFRLLDGEYLYPDHLIVMDHLALEESLLDGIPAHIIRVLGHPGIDDWVKIERSNSREQKTILFLSQPLYELYGDSLGYNQHQVMKDMIKLVEMRPQYSFKVKFHPKDSLSLKESYKDLSIDGVLRDFLTQFGLVIGMNTMGLLFSVLSGVPTISYQPKIAVSDSCITNKLGFTKIIDSFDMLLDYVDHHDKYPKLSNNQYDNNYLWLDGNSTSRVFGFIKEVLSL
ncbi:hypothetical protein SAMN03159341_111127 [Paenibacillus sp. 1_12]|uniref:hypothetical protein n=1 Tax=Paenibacillus sp. 1_12 TaxID=1566278 RepID=UPI0008F07B58|nr:hypothetical protein [Paenibacillus sp. 1_12]SFL89478.1 hypothetical protein SAMN03159341_111127 [Paenibacillus sp. 1_12]